MIFGFSAFNKKSIGLKKIPPPIPTIPDIKPSAEPIKQEKVTFNFLITRLLVSYDLLLISNNIPANIKTKNKINSKVTLLTSKVPPKKANGIDPIKKGNNNLKL